MLLIGNGRVCTRDEAAPWLEDGGVLIDGEVIREVGPLAELRSRYPQARFFELKTVQIMDGEELSKCVNKPCITAGDECYNCEWSIELTVPQAYEEYVKAWFGWTARSGKWTPPTPAAAWTRRCAS